MKLVLYLLPKYLKFDKTQPFIFITATLAFLGISIGVMVLCVAMAIFNGISNELKSKIFAMSYPLDIKPLDRVSVNENMLTSLEENFPNLKFSPYIKAQAAIKTSQSMSAGIIWGVDPKRENAINNILPKVSLEDFQIILGSGFMGYKDKKITLFFTQLLPSGFSLSPIMKRFDVNGYFNSGIRSYDNSYAYTNISSLQKIKNIPNNIFEGIHVYSNDPMNDIKKLNEFLDSQNFGKTIIQGWWHQNGNLFSAMELEKRAMFVVLMLIILMASLNIISSLLMVVMNRRREIALLLSMGAYKSEIKKTFFYLGNTIGICGIVFGLFLSSVVIFILDKFPIISLPEGVYGTQKLPLDVYFLDTFLVIVGAIVIVLLSSFYPAKKASQIDPLSVLRNE